MAFQDEFTNLVFEGVDKAKAAGADWLKEAARKQIEMGKATPEQLKQAAEMGITVAPKKLIGEAIEPRDESKILAEFQPTVPLPGVDKEAFVEKRVIPNVIDSILRFVVPYGSPAGGFLPSPPPVSDPSSRAELIENPNTQFPSTGAFGETPEQEALLNQFTGGKGPEELTPFEKEISNEIVGRRIEEGIALVADPFAAGAKKAPKLADDAAKAADELAENLAGLSKRVQALIAESPEYLRDFLVKRSDNVERWLELTAKVEEIKKTKGFNLDNLNAVDEESIIAAQNLKGKINLSKEEITEMVKDSPFTPDDLAEFGDIYARNPAAFQVSSEMEVLGQIMFDKNTKAIADVRSKLLLDPDNVNLETDLANLITERYQIFSGQQAFGSSAGRTLALRKQPKTQDENLRKATEKVLRSLNKADGERLLKELVEAGDDPAKALDTITKFTHAGYKDKLMEFVVNGLLSKPTTHLRNLAGNALNMSSYMLRTPLEVGFDVMRHFATGSERTVFLSEIPAAFRAFGAGEAKATKQLANDLKLIGSGQGSAIPQIKSDEFQFLPKIGTQFDSSNASSIAGKWIRTPTDILKAEDRFFRTIADEVLQARYAEKVKHGAKLSDKQIAKLIDDQTQELLFQADLGPGLSKVQSIINDSPELKILFPFFKTPMNLFFEGIKHSPAGYARMLWKNRKGIAKGEVAAADFAKATIGTAITMPFINKAVGTTPEGLPSMTGPLPVDPKERRDWFDRGIQPYSIYVNGSYRSYKDMEPFNTPLVMLAQAGEVFRQTGEMNYNLAIPMISAIGQSLSDKASLRTLGDIVDITTGLAEEDSQGAFQAVADFSVEQVTKLVPNIIQGVARGSDQYIRDPEVTIDSLADVPEAIKNKLKSVLPGLSQSLPPKPGKEGLPIERNQGIIGQLFNPFPASAPDVNQYDAEFLRLNWSPPVVSRRVDNISLEPEAFAVYSFLVGQQRKRAYDLVINTPEYESLNDRDKEKILTKATSQANKQAKTLFLVGSQQFESITDKERNKMIADVAENDKELAKLMEAYMTQPLFFNSIENNRKNTEAFLYAYLKDDALTQDVSTKELKDMITEHYDELVQGILYSNTEL